ncbi:hypothetical protein [Halobacterium zhouii]|uniref:hypothetical protein n=1 Tax=Halobacterium zhouii TaxID=2902624 RepID=UPI001E5187C6|nr:hypothetical protein [Halobacterium zhouii]
MSDLTFAKVVTEPAEALALVLDRELTGHAVFTPQDALLLGVDGAGVVAFDDGVPTHVRHTDTDRGGAAALADLAVPGPLRVECYADDAGEPSSPSGRTESDDTGDVPRTDQYAVAPGTPAERLAGDEALADRTRSAAGVAHDGDDESDDLDAVEAFLADEEKVEAIRERAREEAAQRADEWGFETFEDET